MRRFLKEQRKSEIKAMAAYSDFAFFYDRLVDENDYDIRCEYIVNLLAENSVSKGILLDAACGTGILSEKLGEKGFDIIGVDISEEMLSSALERKAKNSSASLYLCQDISQLDLYGTINCAVCTLDSVNHITEPTALKRAFERIGLFMEKGGVFIFDVNTAYKHREVLGNNAFIFDTDEVFCAWQNEYDEKTDDIHVYLDLFAPNDDGSYDRYCEDFSEVIYDRDFLESALDEAGFSILAVYDDLTHDELKEDSQRAVYVCKKITETNSVFENSTER